MTRYVIPIAIEVEASRVSDIDDEVLLFWMQIMVERMPGVEFVWAESLGPYMSSEHDDPWGDVAKAIRE